MNYDDLTDFFGPPIHVVTRADLLADGQLVDVSAEAHKTGFRAPCAVTAGVWGLIEADPTAVGRRDVTRRLRHVLYSAYCYACLHPNAHVGHFHLYLTTPENSLAPPHDQLVTLKLIAGPDDVGETVLTVLLPEED